MLLLKCFGIVHEGHGPGLPGMLKACSLALSRPSVSTSVPSWSTAVSQGRAKSHLQFQKETPVVKRSPFSLFETEMKFSVWHKHWAPFRSDHACVLFPAKAAQPHFTSKKIDCTSIWYLYFWFYSMNNWSKIKSTTKPTKMLLNFLTLWTNFKCFLNLDII